MAKTNAEDRRLRSELSHDLVADAGILRPARTRRDADSLRTQRLNFSDGDLVVAFYHDFAVQHAEILDEVVGNRVVVIDDQDLIHRWPG